MLTNRRVFAQFEDGVPDGLTVDAEGGLWCALYGAGRITRFAPDGAVIRHYDLPCPVVTAPAFGGPEMTHLFVTTGLSPEGTQDSGGAVFIMDTGIKGLAEPVFAA
jgi:sugar lactone lactonase YvrE